MKKIFRFASSFKANESDDGKVRIMGMASTSDTDRAGDVILPEAWTKNDGLRNYEKNPIILFNHKSDKPIGRATAVNVTDRGLELEAEISDADPELQKLVKDGVLSAFSVGFMIKDADYLDATDGFLIKDAELFEVSVVSVPCNQDATFSLAKAFDSNEDFINFKKQFIEASDDSVNTQDDDGSKEKGSKGEPNKENTMTPEELQKMLKETAEKAAKDAADAIAKEAADKKAAEEAEAAKKAAFAVEVKTAAESLLEDVEKRFADKSASMEETINSLKQDLEAKSEEIIAIQKSKRTFAGRNEEGSVTPELLEDGKKAFILGLATGKGWDTKFGKETMEKAANVYTGVEAASDNFEQEVSTQIERDIQHELILAPMFREIQMNSYSMIFPVLPDAGYAEFKGGRNELASGSAAKGNLAQRGDTYGSPYGGVAMTERTLTTKMLTSKSYIGNEVEEDAIMPILPLIQESMVRSHARAVEHAILLGGATGSVFGANSFNGLATFATSDVNLAVAASATMTGADLLTARKGLGKYGMRPSDVVYIVNERSYFELIEDTEWQDVNQVNADSMKLKGAVGKIYGSNVVVCDEFATPANDAFCGIAVNPRNFIMPRLRGLTLEQDYEVGNQRRLLVATQRLGFDEIIQNATAAVTISYAGA